MAARLGERENTDRTNIIAGESRIKTLIEEIHNAVIVANEKEEILFINITAKKVLNLGDVPLIGQSVSVLPKSNLLKTIVENKDTTQLLEINIGGKTTSFQQRSLEISIPNLKPDLDSLQLAAYPAGMIYVLKEGDSM